MRRSDNPALINTTDSFLVLHSEQHMEIRNVVGDTEMGVERLDPNGSPLSAVIFYVLLSKAQTILRLSRS